MTIANELYKQVDVESADGVKHQISNYCANNEHLIELIESQGIYTHVVFIDGSAINFDDYGVSVAG